jgi:hypothetical protein
MPNPIKYNTSTETLSLKKGNFWIGTGDVGKGPTSTTGFYNGITPPSGGYTIYVNKATGGPSIMVANNDASLIAITNSIAGASYTTVNQCFNYFAGQSDKMVVQRDYEGIVTDGLILNLDAGYLPSYPQNGTTWYDLGPSGNTGTLTNGPTFNSGSGGSIVFDGVDDFIVGTLVVPAAFTFNVIFKANSTSQWAPEFNIWPNYPSGDRGWNIFSMTAGGTTSTGTYAGTDVATRFHPNDTSGTIIPNQIQNITFTHENGTSKLYRNGSLTHTKPQTAPQNVGQTKNYTLFSRPTHSPGNLYLAQFYNRALSATEVLQNFNATKSRFGL